MSPNNPVLLTHASGHAAFVNGKAMEAAGVTRETPNPPGGEILKDARAIRPACCASARPAGQPRACGLRKPGALPADRRPKPLNAPSSWRSTNRSPRESPRFEDAGSPFATVDVLKRMADSHELRMRLWMMLRVPNEELAAKLDQYRIIGAGGNFLTVRAIKRAIDGALGSRGAWLLEPYTDKPDSSGLNTDDPADIRKTADLAIQHGFQLCVHAIGDRANRETLDIFEQTFQAHPDQKDLRWRIEHAQHLSAADIPRFGKLGVIAAMQGIHCTSDAPYVLLRLGREAGRRRRVRLAEADEDRGAIVANGTDAPVEDVSPLASFYATVSRKLKDGSVFYPRPADEPRGGAALLHLEQRVRGVRREAEGLARSRASWPTSRCSRATS